MRKIFLFIVPLLFCVFSINAQSINAEENAAISLVSASKTTLGLSAEDLGNVMVTSTYYDNASGVRMVYLTQTYQGIPVYNQMLVLAFKGDKLASKAGAFNHSLEKLVNVNSGMPSVTAESAVQSALSDRGLRASQMAVAISTKNNGHLVEFSNMGISRENITARLMWTPIEGSKEIRLSWHVYIIPKTTPDYWMVRVDAVNNSILGMDNYTDYDHWGTPDVSGNVKYPAFTYGNLLDKEGDKSLLDFKKSDDPSLVTTATYRVVPYPSEAPSFPNGAHALRTDPWLSAPGNATTLRWHTGLAAADYSHTRSNNVFAYQDRANDNNGSIADAASSSTAFPSLTFNFTPDYTVDPTQTTPVPNQQFNTTNLFYWNNVIHDMMYIYGFTEAAFNFQDDNMGRGGAGNDHVNAEAQDGGGSNNANFATPADGTSGRMQMYLWTGGTPQRDGDVDNGIIVHEYGHGISNRLTGGGGGGCLGNAEQMGEGWSDYYGLMFTHDWATATLNQGFTTPRGIGTYALFQPPTGVGIRSQRYCTDFTVNNKVYLASLPAGPHPRGEIWCATLWDMTWNIINQVGTINPNLYNLAGGGGNAIAMRLVTEGLKMQQCSPGFISGRNGILAADQVLYGGLYSCAIWEAFRRRGMGAFASEGSTSSVTDQVPDFTPPITLGATVSAVTIPEGSNLTYTNSITTCNTVTGYTLRDTLPLNVTYVSGGTYDAATRVVSFPVNQAAGTTNYIFTVNVNPGSYFPPISLLNETVAGPTIPASWTTTAPIGNLWTVSNVRSRSAPNSFYAINPAVASDERLENTTAIALPANSYPKLSFWSSWNTEDGWDGGVVEISTNGGATWTDLGPNMISGGYNGGLGAAPTNPLSGRPAFTGQQATFVNTIVNLSQYAGQSVKIRFRFGSDDNTSAPTAPAGWWVDDITLDAIAAVQMRTSLFNATNTRVFLRDMVTEITQLVACFPTITQQPADAAVCSGSPATFTTVGTAVGGVTYQWQISTTGIGGPYTNLANGAPYSGVTLSTLTINPATVAMNGNYYRAVVTGSCAPTATSNPARLTVATSSVPGTVTPANSQVCGTTNSGTLTVAGHNGNIVRWESATNIAGPWTPIANTTTTYTFNNITQTMYYRAVSQFGTCGETNSSIATVTFTASAPIVIVADPGTTICAGDPTRLTVHEGSFTGPLTIPLNNQTSTFTGSVRGYYFTAPTNFTMTALRVPTDASAGTQNIAVMRMTGATPPPAFPGTTNAFTTLFLTQVNPAVGNIPVNIPILAGEVIAIMGNRVNVNSYSNPPNVTTIAGFPVTLLRMGMQFPLATTAPQQLWSENAGSISRVFFEYTYGSVGPVVTGGTFLWTPAAGLSSTTSNPTAASPMTTTTYTVNHNNGAGCVRQANITITVNQRPVVTTQPASVAACNGASATFTVGGTGTGLAYQWQVSTTGPGGPWTNLTNVAPYTGVNTATLIINPVTLALNGNNYRAVLTGTCAPVGTANVSNAAVLTVNALPAVTVTPTSGCGGVAGINGLLLTASGANTYTWAPITGLYTDPNAVTPYTGGNTPTVYAAPTVYTAYTVTGTNTTTGCSNTATALINYTPPAPSVTPNPVTMCLGDPAVKLKSSSSQSFSNSFASGPVNITIPDGPAIPPVPTSYPATTSSITVAGIPAGATITGVRARFNVTHAWVSDLVIALKAPNGNIFNLDALINKTNQPGANFTNTVISSAGITPLGGAAPYTGTFRPDAAGATFTALGFTWPGGPVGYVPNVAAYSGLYSVPNGVWSIGIYDAGAPDAGVLNNWSLDIDYIIGVAATPAVWTPIAGLFSDANATVPYVAGTAVDSVWTRPTPAGVYTYQATVQSQGLPPSAIQTTFANNNQFAMVTSNFKNNNGFPVTITGIESIASTNGASIATLYYKTTAVNGAPGAISAANGWIVAGTAPYTAIANTTTTTPQPMLSGLSLIVPAGATYGFAFESKTAAGVGNLRYSTVAAGTYTNSANGCDLISGSNVSFAGDIAPNAPTFTPRAFIGRVLFGNPVIACTSPARTVVVTVNQPTTLNTTLPVDQVVCTDKVATFTAAVAGGTGPHTYQWQVSIDNGTSWTNITNAGVYSGATTATLTITAPPVTMNNYLYRAVINGAAPCAAATSRIAKLTVNPLPTVTITVNRRSLIPGLTATITSTSSPAAATYTWLRNGVVVPNANTGTLIVNVDQLGTYRLRVTDINGCIGESPAIGITIRDSVSAKCFIYPNPTSGKFQVRYYSDVNNVLPRNLTVYDSKGDRVFTQMFPINSPYTRMDVDMRAYGKGLYWVEIGDINGNRITMCRVAIQ